MEIQNKNDAGVIGNMTQTDIQGFDFVERDFVDSDVTMADSVLFEKWRNISISAVVVDYVQSDLEIEGRS